MKNTRTISQKNGAILGMRTLSRYGGRDARFSVRPGETSYNQTWRQRRPLQRVGRVTSQWTGLVNTDRLWGVISPKPISDLTFAWPTIRAFAHDGPMSEACIQLCERPCNHQRDVILLFATATELLDRPNY